jgi:hypothetical protein
MTSKLRNNQDRVNKNLFDEAGLIYAGNYQFKGKLDLFLFWPLGKSVINFQFNKSFTCSNPEIFAVEMKR